MVEWRRWRLYNVVNRTPIVLIPRVLYPWHPWFGRAVWIFLTQVNHGRMVAHCGLEPRHESRGVEVPLWMFDTAVCCQMRMAPVPVVNIEALHELAALLAAQLRPDGGPMLQAPSTIPCYPKEVLMRVPPSPRPGRPNLLCFSRAREGRAGSSCRGRRGSRRCACWRGC